jgi:hypothetical protein
MLAAVYAMAWAARQALLAADAENRFLELLIEGLAARHAQPAADRAAPRPVASLRRMLRAGWHGSTYAGRLCLSAATQCQ